MTREFIGFRADNERMFELSGIKDESRIKHSNLIVIRENGDVAVLGSSHDLLDEEPNSDVLYRWRGEWSSDMFHFKAKEYQDLVNKDDLS